MKKVLIYHRENMLKPTGGPNGYLFSLKEGLDGNMNDKIQIDFLPAVNANTSIKEGAKTSKNPIIKWLLAIYRRIKHVRTIFKILNNTKTSPVVLDAYDAVHFHATRDMYLLREQLKEYEGKVILTSHSPQPLSDEYIESSSPLELKIFGKKYSSLINMDRFAFERADYVIFPCQFADESYLHAWEDYHRIKDSKKENYRYLLTGTVPANVKRERNAVRSSLNIPDDAFVLCYVGRHNEIKGYDRLKAVGEKILNAYPNTYVVIAGNPGPIEPIKHERWIEVGWTNEPHSYIAASDVFILPNKETYFDLVLLEVLSIGVPIIASQTGGNKYFESNEGVLLFDTEEECINMIEKVMMKNSEEIENIYETNKKYYQENFTTEVFAQNYIDILSEIV